jgi:hypothetical protein
VFGNKSSLPFTCLFCPFFNDLQTRTYTLKYAFAGTQKQLLHSAIRQFQQTYSAGSSNSRVKQRHDSFIGRVTVPLVMLVIPTASSTGSYTASTDTNGNQSTVLQNSKSCSYTPSADSTGNQSIVLQNSQRCTQKHYNCFYLLHFTAVNRLFQNYPISPAVLLSQAISC